MPIRYDRKSKTWCYGSKCGFKNRDAALVAQRVAHAKKRGGKERDMKKQNKSKHKTKPKRKKGNRTKNRY